MPTAIVKSIGSAGGRDYATPQAFEDALPSNLVTADESWTGEMYNDSEFTSKTDFSGSTTDATRFVKLTTATGQSFRDHASAATNPLTYDQSKGVGISLSTGYDPTLGISIANITVENIQIKRTSSSGAAARVINAENTNTKFVKNCIILGEQTNADSVRFGGSSSIISNFLVIHTHTSRDALQLHNSATALNVTAVSPSDVTATGIGIKSNYGSPIAKNCASFGFNTDFDSTWNSSSNYNASDGTGSPGANSVDSLTFADQFEVVTTSGMDFRAKSGNNLQAGVADLTLDIIGQTRADPPTIGAWEFISGGGGGATVVMTIGESLAAVDQSTGKLSAILSVSESAGASDIDQGQYATSQEIIEAVQANDLTTALFNALLTQNLGAIVSDSVSFKTTFGLTFNESVSGTDNQGSIASLGLTVSETASGEDTDSGKASLISTLSESLSGSDSLSFTTPGIILTIGETVASSDNLSISAQFKMTIGESANITDSASSKASLISNIAEAITSSDAFNRISVFSLTIGEAVSAIDLLSAIDANLLGLITATITIDPLITASSVINPLISGTIDAIPTITGTIKVT
jgi:hypothetical protein